MLYLCQNVGCESRRLSAAGSALLKIAMSTVAWFLAVAWLDLAGTQIDAKLAVMAGIFVASLTLLLVAVSPASDGLGTVCQRR